MWNLFSGASSKGNQPQSSRVQLPPGPSSAPQIQDNKHVPYAPGATGFSSAFGAPAMQPSSNVADAPSASVPPMGDLFGSLQVKAAPETSTAPVASGFSIFK